MGRKQYFNDFYSYIDIGLFTTFVFYFIYRNQYTVSLVPSEYLIGDEASDMKIDYDLLTKNSMTPNILAYFAQANLILYLTMGLKVMSFMRFLSNLG